MGKGSGAHKDGLEVVFAAIHHDNNKYPNFRQPQLFRKGAEPAVAPR